MQCAVIEFARNVCGISKANSSEFKKNKYSVIDLMPDQKNIKESWVLQCGWVLILVLLKRAQMLIKLINPIIFPKDTATGLKLIINLEQILSEKGMVFSGFSPDRELVEIIELPDHPWFLGCQFHPELKSRATKAHPLFREFY